LHARDKLVLQPFLIADHFLCTDRHRFFIAHIRGILGSTGCQPVPPGSLPGRLGVFTPRTTECSRQAAANYRLAACPQPQPFAIKLAQFSQEAAESIPFVFALFGWNEVDLRCVASAAPNSNENNAQVFFAFTPIRLAIFRGRIVVRGEMRRASASSFQHLVPIERKKFLVASWPPGEGIDPIKSQHVIDAEKMKAAPHAAYALPRSVSAFSTGMRLSILITKRTSSLRSISIWPRLKMVSLSKCKALAKKRRLLNHSSTRCWRSAAKGLPN
jgi:hypothetical protein